MLSNYLKAAYRRLRRQAGYTAIHVTGLAIGLAVCLLIGQYVGHELSYDRHHEKANRIVRVTRAWDGHQGGSGLHLARVSAPIAPALEAAFPEVVETVRIWGNGGLLCRDERCAEVPRLYFAGADVFSVFTIPFVAGRSERALDAPFTVVLTRTVARQYFGDADPTGQTLQLDGEYTLQVTGVIDDPPRNTHFRYGALVSLATLEALLPASRMASWTGYNNYATYLLLREGTDTERLEAQLPAFLDHHRSVDASKESTLNLQPLLNIHLHSDLDGELETNGDVMHVYLFSIIALIVLVTACFNYANLATAQSMRRTQEIGTRKALGAERRWLAGQILIEGVLVAGVAVGGAVMLARLAVPLFERLTSIQLIAVEMPIACVAVVLVGTALLVGLLAAGYPAAVLSALSPTEALHAAHPASTRSRLRTVLIVAQFAISIALIAGVGVLYSQLHYMQTKDLGFEDEHLVVLSSSDAIEQRFGSIRIQLMDHPHVQSVTASEYTPSAPLVNPIDGAAEAAGAMRPFQGLPILPVDFDFVETYGLRVVAGRAFNKERASDSTQAFIVNEAAVRQMGWVSPSEAIGKRVALAGSSVRRQGRVVGVVEDFHFESLRERIAPMLLFVMPERCRLVTVKIDGRDVPQTLDFLKDRWASYRPQAPFSYTFVDQQFDQLYRAEQRVGSVASAFAGLAVFIACLGLIGLTALMTERRRKEIGIRKALGATVHSVVVLLSREYAGLIGVAFVVAAPVVYLAMHRWLQGFAYHVGMSLWVFLGAGLVVAALALATVGAQAVRAARTDPVDVFRYE